MKCCWVSLGYWVTVVALGLSTGSLGEEVFAKRLRQWEKDQQQRYLTSYRGWMKAVETSRQQLVYDYLREERAALSSMPADIVDPAKLTVYFENEARTRLAYFVEFSAAIGDCYEQAVQHVIARAQNSRDSIPKSDDELDCPRATKLKEAEKVRRNSITTMASLAADVKELAEERARKAKEEEEERLRREELARKKAAEEATKQAKLKEEAEAKRAAELKKAEEAKNTPEAKAAENPKGEKAADGKAADMKPSDATPSDTGEKKVSSPKPTTTSSPPPAPASTTSNGPRQVQIFSGQRNAQPQPARQQMQPPVPVDRFGRPIYFPPGYNQQVQQNPVPAEARPQGKAPAPPGEPQPKPASVPLRTFEGQSLSISWVWDGHQMGDYMWNRETSVIAAGYLSGSVSSQDMDYNDKGQLVYKGRTLVPNIYLQDQAGNLIRSTEAEDWHNAAIKKFVDARLKVRRLAAIAKGLSKFDKITPAGDVVPVTVLGDGKSEAEPSVVFSIRDFALRFRNKIGLRVVDKEGFIANPAIRYEVHRNNTSGSAYLNLAFFVPNPRIHFDNPCTISEKGTWKFLSIGRSKPQKSIYVSIYPDRDTESERYELSVQYWESNTAVADSAAPVIPSEAKLFTLPIIVEDQDKPDKAIAPNQVLPAPSFPYAVAPEIPLLEAPFPAGSNELNLPKTAPYTVNLDFRLDRTGFFSGETTEAELHRNIFARAALDASYFIGEMNLKPVQKNEESTGILFRRLVSGEKVKDLATYISNGYEYEGMLFHVLASEEKVPINSMGGASGSGLHKSQRGSSTGLRRSGEILFEGVHRTDEIVTDMSEENWWKVVYKPKEPVDLYSLALHEFLHGFCFDETYQAFGKWLEEARVGEFAVEDYQGAPVSVDGGAHLSGQIDRESQRATFGEKNDGRMPQHRWLLTQLDLLLMQKNGYHINPAGLPLPPVWQKDSLAQASKGVYYKHAFQVTGGIPDYSWRIVEGRLPEGMALDSFAGTIAGTPTEHGDFHLVFSFRDSSNQEYGAELRHYTLSVTRR